MVACASIILPMLLGRTVKYVAAAAQPSRRGVVVLIYHRVGGESGSAVDLEPALFAEQLRWLHEHRRVVSIDVAVDALVAHEDVDDVVVITFDDGTADFADHVVPALMAQDTPATLYVATDFMDRGEPFPWGAPPISWAALRDAASTGLVTVGSHTHTHRLLDRCDDATVRGEIDRSIDRIGTELDAQGYAVIPSVLSPNMCNSLAKTYEDETLFRNIVTMAHHGFGRDEYKYFAYPLPLSHLTVPHPI